MEIKLIKNLSPGLTARGKDEGMNNSTPQQPMPAWTPVKCPNCLGYTTVKWGKVICPTCEGLGYIKVPIKNDEWRQHGNDQNL